MKIPSRKLKRSTPFETLPKVQPCKLYNNNNNNNNKYKIVSAKITNTEISAFIAVLIFKLMNRKVLFINREDNRNC